MTFEDEYLFDKITEWVCLSERHLSFYLKYDFNEKMLTDALFLLQGVIFSTFGLDFFLLSNRNQTIGQILLHIYMSLSFVWSPNEMFFSVFVF